MNDFEEYIRQGEPQKREKGYAWQTAIGLQAVDDLKPSEYLIQTARQHIEGDITIEEAKQLIDSYYESKTVRADIKAERKKPIRFRHVLLRYYRKKRSHSRLLNISPFIAAFSKVSINLQERSEITISPKRSGC